MKCKFKLPGFQSWRIFLVVVLFATTSYLLRNCEQSCPYSESGHKNNSLEFSDKQP